MKRLIAFITMGIILLCSFAYAEVDFDVNKYTFHKRILTWNK